MRKIFACGLAVIFILSAQVFQRPNTENLFNQQPFVEVTTDKYCYEVGETVKIVVEGWFGVSSVTILDLVGPIILNEWGDYVVEPVRYNGPFAHAPNFFIGPKNYTWDQKYAIYDKDSLGWWPPLIPPSGEQVPKGKYIIWFGWWRLGFDDWMEARFKNLTTPAEIKIGDCALGPIADAGPDQIVYEGQEVQFDGSGSIIPIDRCSKNVGFEKSIRVNDAPGKAFSGLTSLALDENDIIYVAWDDNRSGIGYLGYDIYLSRSLDGGLTFEPNVRVNEELDDVFKMGASIAATGVGKVYAVWLDGRNSQSDIFWEIGFDIYFAKSSDGGKTFGNNIKLNEEGGVFHHYLYRPSIAVDTAGNIHVAWHTNKNGEYNIYYSKSTDGGLSFTPNVKVNDITDTYKRFQVSMATDIMNNVYITWVDYRNGESNPNIYFSKSMDGGNTFSKNIRVNDDGNTSPPGSFQEAPDVLVDEDNHIYVVWQDLRPIHRAIYFSKSIDGGKTFSKNIRIDDYQGFVYQVGPKLSIDPACDYIMTVWQDYRDGNYDIFFMRSNKDGQPLSSSVEVSDFDGIAQQTLPSMAVDSLGFIHVVWMDERYPGTPAIRDIQYSKGMPTRDNQSQNSFFKWDLNDHLDSDNDGNFTNDVDATGPNPSHIYGDDGIYNVTLTLRYSSNDSIDFDLHWVADIVDLHYDVALGDIDLDGDLDFIAGNNGPNRVYINDGGGNFTLLSSFIENEPTSSAALGDLDGDGDLDYIAGNCISQPSRIYLNDGSGNFTLHSSFDSVLSPSSDCVQHVTMDDLDNDGDLDFIFGMTQNNGAPNVVYINDGMGNFTESWASFEDDRTYSIALGDIDQDGDLDQMVGNIGPVRVYKNDGNANFSLWESTPIGSPSYDVEPGDLDNDGDLDFIAGTDVFLNKGNGSFTWTGSFGVYLDNIFSGSMGDLDNDGDLDFIAGNIGNNGTGGQNRIYLNDGNANFHLASSTNEVDITWDDELGDFDNDGDLDYIAGNLVNKTKAYTINFRKGGSGISVDTVKITVLNLPPDVNIENIYVPIDLTLRIAGEKWHDVTLYLYEDGVEIWSATIVRQPGNPDDQTATIESLYLDLTKQYSAKVVYTPENDPVNGQPKGATPAWIILTFEDGSEERIHHTFNVNHPGTWEWNVVLNQYLTGHELTFEAFASDAGSDDLTFNWSWGDGSPDNITTYFNNAPVDTPDPYPSPWGTYPFFATDEEKHEFTTTGIYTITLTVTDDDGGSVISTVTIELA